MKHFAAFLFFLLTTNLQAQVQYGTIDYVRQTEMSISSDVVDDKMMKDLQEQMMAAGAFTDNFTATFSPEGFAFVQKPKEEVSIESEMAGGGIIIMQTGGEEPSSFYTDTKEGEMTNYDFIFDKGFLIEGPIETLEWTITDEKVPPSEATVGLDLILANAITSNGDTITAGFAPSLPIQVGPRNFYGLPGAIITLRIPGKNGGGTLFRATSLSVSAEPIPMAKPTKGKKITPEKFRAEQKKREKMMARQFRH